MLIRRPLDWFITQQFLPPIYVHKIAKSHSFSSIIITTNAAVDVVIIHRYRCSCCFTYSGMAASSLGWKFTHIHNSFTNYLFLYCPGARNLIVRWIVLFFKVRSWMLSSNDNDNNNTASIQLTHWTGLMKENLIQS